MNPKTVNEITFVGRLASATAVRADRLRQDGDEPLIASAEIEETQRDATGSVRRCDMRLNSPNRRKLVSGEMKRPELPEGRDPRNPALVQDARAKAVARGLPFYFTCNMSEVVLFGVADTPGGTDHEEASYELAPISHSSETNAYEEEIREAWFSFLDDLSRRLKSVEEQRPPVTSTDVLKLRDAIADISEEALPRAKRRLENDKALLDQVRLEAEDSFEFTGSLNPNHPPSFSDNLRHVISFGVFVIAQKLVLYRVLQEAGERRPDSFTLDPLDVPRDSSDPRTIEAVLDGAFKQAIIRSGDYETAFNPKPLKNLVFTEPINQDEVHECQVGEAWDDLIEAIDGVSWSSIERSLIGFLYEVVAEPEFRHRLGQYYTREDIVDLLVGFSVQDIADSVLDPACGGGSFLTAAYRRKRELGDTHVGALERIWGCEITAFSAELSTVALATADPRAEAAYPRVLPSDFFDMRPGMKTDSSIPENGERLPLLVPKGFDAVVGNPPYISYRSQTNQDKVISALVDNSGVLDMPRFSGKSDSSVWFIAHATRFLEDGGRLAFVLTSGLLYDDYGVPVIQFLAKHYKIRAVINSMVERWFVDQDYNTFLLLAERCSDRTERESNDMRFIRLRRPIGRLLEDPSSGNRRESVEDLLDLLLTSDPSLEDPRFRIQEVQQGEQGGLIGFDELVPSSS